jgi:putative transposase
MKANLPRALCENYTAQTGRFFNNLKNERVHRTRYSARAVAEADLFNHIEPLYNRKRRHFTLG